MGSGCSTDTRTHERTSTHDAGRMRLLKETIRMDKQKRMSNDTTTTTTTSTTTESTKGATTFYAQGGGVNNQQQQQQKPLSSSTSVSCPSAQRDSEIGNRSEGGGGNATILRREGNPQTECAPRMFMISAPDVSMDDPLARSHENNTTLDSGAWRRHSLSQSSRRQSDSFGPKVIPRKPVQMKLPIAAQAHQGLHGPSPSCAIAPQPDRQDDILFHL